MKFKVTNWESHQHYKKRTPPWIKLHRGLLDDHHFHCLPVASKALAPMLWLLASESEGVVDVSPEFLSFRFRMSEPEVVDAVNPLISRGWITPIDDASKALAKRLHDATLETEGETETETETNNRSAEKTPDRFGEFWKAYPKKVKKQEASKKWKARKLDRLADQILADIQTRQKSDRRWVDGFVPDPTTYINGSRWEDEIDTSKPGPPEKREPTRPESRPLN